MDDNNYQIEELKKILIVSERLAKAAEHLLAETEAAASAASSPVCPAPRGRRHPVARPRTSLTPQARTHSLRTESLDDSEEETTSNLLSILTCYCCRWKFWNTEG